MQIGIRLHDIRQAPLMERLKIAHAQGFVCGHMALAMVMQEHSVESGALTPGFAMYLRKLFRENRMDIAVLGCYLNLANPDREQLAAITERYLAHIRLASLLGCGVVGTETGAPNIEYRHVPECRSDDALNTFISNFRPVVAYAQQLGVLLAIEPVWSHIVYNPGRARQVLDGISSPNLQVIFDPVNLINADNYQDRDAIVQEAIELLGREIAVIHLKDFAVHDDRILSVPIGTGLMNYERILRFIKREKPYIHVILEETKPDNAVSAREYIEKTFAAV